MRLAIQFSPAAAPCAPSSVRLTGPSVGTCQGFAKPSLQPHGRQTSIVTAVLSSRSNNSKKVAKPAARQGTKGQQEKNPSSPQGLSLGLGGAILGSLGIAFIGYHGLMADAAHLAQHADAHGSANSLYDLLGTCTQPINTLHSSSHAAAASSSVETAYQHPHSAASPILTATNVRGSIAALQASIVPFSPDFISSSCPYVASPAATPAAINTLVHHAAHPAVAAAADATSSGLQHANTTLTAVLQSAGV